MKPQLVAYLFPDHGKVSAMPTNELLVALHQVAQGSTLAGQSVSFNYAGVYGFLQALQRAMHTAKPREI